MTQQTEAGVITMTERASSKMAALLRERGDDPLVRVFVEGGGCSGYRYGLAPSRELRPGDVTLEQGELTLVIDPESLSLMRGASIDFVEQEMSSGFTIDNPNAPAASSCNCGHSAEDDRCC